MYKRGSEWRKWDLHVHTPASIVSNYGGDTDATWEKFITDLECLSPEFKVLGVNDYLFVDGYERLLTAKNSGRLSNIDTLLPVIELRIDKFAGTSGPLRRANFHVIFEESIEARIIRSQFLASLLPEYKLSPEWDSSPVRWNGVIDRDSLQDLGRKIIASVPEGERKNYHTPLIEGFNNLTVSLEQVQKTLRAEYFRGRTLTAIGKSEWTAIRWQDGSIADKKTLINSADIVFVAAEIETAYHNARDSLRGAAVNDRLLDCSDAHSFSTSTDKDRIGNCLTWIKADPTFAGLKHALREFESRVFVGTRPSKLQMLVMNPGKFIDSVRIEKVAGAPLDEVWFDVQLPLNPDLTAIIGNKGSGKSALADIVGLLGRTKHSADFSFLNDKKFRLPRNNKSKYFRGTLHWASGQSITAGLEEDIPRNITETVRYLPQNYLEKLCNELTDAGDTGFDRELRTTIFSHLKHENRLGQESLDSLISFRTNEVWDAIAQLRVTLAARNAELIEIEQKMSAPYKEALERKLAAVKSDIESLQTKIPKVLEAPKADTPAAQQLQRQLEELRANWKALQQQIGEKQKHLDHLMTLGEVAIKLNTKLETVSSYVAAHRLAMEADAKTLAIKNPLYIEIDKAQLELRSAEIARDIDATGKELDEFRRKQGEQNAAGLAVRARLEEKSRQREQSIIDLEAWQQKMSSLRGDVETPGTALYLEDQIKRLGDLPAQFQRATEARDNVAAAIFEKLLGLGQTYRALYQPVQDFIDKNPVVKARFELSFSVALVESNFQERLFDILTRQHVGSFQGMAEGDKVAKEILSRADFQTIAGLEAFLHDVFDKLSFDRRTAESRPMTIESQLKRGHTKQELYDFLFGLSYLQPHYALKLGQKSLQLLSPGERGLLLLVFYLLVDLDTAPLIIDQPEENLDNQTIYELLVPCIKEAKLRRQVVIVTHNPNLAVVCDAEQIVVAKMDTVDSRVTYVSGSVENPVINAEVVKILEGTMPAFVNRDVKYLR